MGKLAIAILTKNEIANIEAVIKNAQQCTDEILIIDSGSTDGTIEKSIELGAKVCYRAWDNDFAAQRNFALSQTEADWILYLDADERLNPDAVNNVNGIIKNESLDTQFDFKRKSVAFGQAFNYGVLKPDFVARLFPTTKVKWINKVHEKPTCALPKKRVKGHLEHYTYTSWEQWEGKFCQYTTIWADDAYSQGKHTTLLKILIHSLGGFFKMLIVRLGFLDGYMGIFMCCNHFFYTMLKYLKLYERQLHLQDRRP